MRNPAPSVAYAIALKTGTFGFQSFISPVTSGHLYLKVSDGVCLRSRYAPNERPESLRIWPSPEICLRMSMRSHLWSPSLGRVNPSRSWELDLRDHLLSALDIYWYSQDSLEARLRFLDGADYRVLNWLSTYRSDRWPELISVESGTGR